MSATLALDVRTLVFIASIVSIVTSSSMALAWRVSPKNESLRRWAAGFICGAVGFILIWFRGIVPDFLSIPVANAFMVIGLLLSLHGINAFLDLPNPVWPSVTIVVVMTGMVTYFTYVEPSMAHRVIIMSGGTGAIALLAAWRLAAHPIPELRLTQTLVANLLAIHGFVMAARIAATLLSPPGEDFFEPNLATLVTCIDFFLLFPCLGVGMLLMVLRKSTLELENEVRQRQQSEAQLRSTASHLETVIEDMKTLKGVIPICSSCKKIRDDEGVWNQLEAYISEHSDAAFSHGICPDCTKKLYSDL